MTCGWLKEIFWQYLTIHGLDKYNTMFQNVKKVLHQNSKLILKFHKNCNSISYAFIFPAYIFAIIFGKPKDSLYQQGLIDSYWL